MIINIRDIPHEGQDFHFSENDIDVRGFIYPLKGGFDLHGEVTAKTPADCSFCANTIKIPIKEKFHEIVMLTTKARVKSKDEFVPHDELEVLYVNGNELNLKPVIEQIIAVSIPIQPKCLEKGAPEGYPQCVADWDYKKYATNDLEMPSVHPFEILKTLKKN